MPDWNVIVTTKGGGFQQAQQALRSLGEVEETGYYNVLGMAVDDPEAFLEKLEAMGSVNPDLLDAWISRVVPADRSFEFSSAEEFRKRAGRATRELASAVAGRSFHVRMERRGFEGSLDSREVERELGDVVLDALREEDESAEVSFDDPDAVLAVETVSTWAGVSLITRERRERYPFVTVD